MKTRATALLSSLLLLAVTAHAAPRIKLTDDTFNFGKMPRHAVANHRFWIKAVGDSEVKITKAVPDCGCTELILKDSTVAPGDSVALDVIFHSRSFMGFISKRPTLEIQGSDEKTFVKFYAEIEIDPTKTTPLVITPARVDVSQFGEKTRRKTTFTISNNTIHDYTITVIDSSYKSFDIKLPSVIKAGEQLTGEISVKKAAVTTSFEEAFTFEITDDGRSRFTVPIARLYNPKKSPGMSLSKD